MSWEAKNNARFIEGYGGTKAFQHAQIVDPEIPPRAAAKIKQKIVSTYCKAQSGGGGIWFTPCRPRPSALYRTDIEFKGLSSPRWVCRSYVLKRDQVPADGGVRETFLGFVNVRPFKRIKGASVISSEHAVLCSAFLIPPESMPEDRFFVITVDLGLYQGELRGLRTAPYIREPGEPLLGLSPEASICMASFLMARFGAIVCGFTDVVHINSGYKNKLEGRFPIPYKARSKLTPSKLMEGLRKYFKAAQLNSFRFSVSKKNIARDVNLLRSYLHCGFPVLLCQETTPGDYHVVTIVGYERIQPDPGKHLFVLHDPNLDLRSGISGLGAYEMVSAANLFDNGKDCVVPVPKQLLAPLDFEGNRVGHSRSVSIRSRMLQHKLETDTKKQQQESVEKYVDGSALSVSAGYVLLHRDALYNRFLVPSIAVECKKKWLKEQINKLPEFMWVQEFRDATSKSEPLKGFWTWDATKKHLKKAAPMPVGQCDGKTFQVKDEHSSFRLKLKDGKIDVDEHEELGVAVITSFSDAPFKETLKTLVHQGIESIALYVFNDVEIRDYLRLNEPIPTRALARAVRKRNQIEYAAEKIVDDLEEVKSLSRRTAKIVGLTTYIPEITSHIKQDTSVGIEALKAVVTLAKELCARGQEVRFIEIVGGPRGYPKKVKRRRVEWQAVLEVESRYKRLKNSLAEVLNHALDLKCPCHLAMELEPGSFNLIRDEDELERFIEEICMPVSRDVAAGLQSVSLGVNIDVMHFKLAGISPDWIQKPGVREHVRHAHFADMAPFGHICDVPVKTIHDASSYEVWVQALLNIQAMGPQKGVYSGYVSIEMEAPRCSEQVFSSYHRLQVIIEDVLWKRRGFTGCPALGIMEA